MRKMTIVALGALLLTAGANAVPISDSGPLPAQDRAAITQLEQQLFDQLARDGVEKTLAARFPAIVNDQANLEAMREIDSNCGVVSSAERIAVKSFGTRAIREDFILVMGSCLVKWELTYLKIGVAWKLNNMAFKSNESTW